MNDPLQVAANKGRTIWLQNLLRELLPKLNQSPTNYQSWFDSPIKFMEDRGLVELTHPILSELSIQKWILIS